MQTTLGIPDYAIVVGFFVVMLGIGFYYAGRMKSLKDYFSGGRRVPWWLSGASMWMSSFSAFAFVSYSEIAYKYGLASCMLFWVTVPAMVLSAFWLAARWRRAATTSPLEYIETRYGPGLRRGLAWIGAPLTVIDDALKLLAIGTMLAVSLRMEIHWVIIGSGLLMLAYTFMGGLWAVLVTDFVQFIIMMVAVIVLVPLSFTRVGGVHAFFEGSPEGFFSPFTSLHTPWYLFSFFALMILSTSTRWSFVQRYYAVETDNDARKVGYLVAALNFIGPPLMFMPAMAARQYMPGLSDTREVYALICTSLLPVGMMGMIIAAMFSATMSMLSGDYNAVAAVLTNDIYRRAYGRDASERTLLWVGRIATILIGLVAIVIGLYIAATGGKSSLFDIMTQLFGVLLPPMAVPMVAGLISRRVSNVGGLVGFALSAVVGIAAFAIGSRPEYAYLRANTHLPWITTGSAVIGLLIGTYLRPNTKEEDKRNKSFLAGLSGRHVAPQPEEEGVSSHVSPLPVIGASMAALGALMVVVLFVTTPLRACVASMVTGFVMLLLGIAFWAWPTLAKASAANAECIRKRDKD